MQRKLNKSLPQLLALTLVCVVCVANVGAQPTTAPNIKSPEDYVVTLPPAEQQEFVEGFAKKGMMLQIPHVWKYIRDPAIYEGNLDHAAEPFDDEYLQGLKVAMMDKRCTQHQRISAILYRYHDAELTQAFVKDLDGAGSEGAAEILVMAAKSEPVREKIKSVYLKHLDNIEIAAGIASWDAESRDLIMQEANVNKVDVRFARELALQGDKRAIEPLKGFYPGAGPSDNSWIAAGALVRLGDNYKDPMKWMSSYAKDAHPPYPLLRDQAISSLGIAGGKDAIQLLRFNIEQFLAAKLPSGGKELQKYSDLRRWGCHALNELSRLKDPSSRELGPQVLKKVIDEGYEVGLAINCAVQLAKIRDETVDAKLVSIMGQSWVDRSIKILALTDIPVSMLPKMSRFELMEPMPLTRIPLELQPGKQKQ